MNPETHWGHPLAPPDVQVTACGQLGQGLAMTADEDPTCPICRKAWDEYWAEQARLPPGAGGRRRREQGRRDGQGERQGRGSEGAAHEGPFAADGVHGRPLLAQ
jgi:hypothetical protein